MKWLVLLVLTGLTTASNLELGDRIVATEQECGRIFKLNENWSTSNFHEQAVQYVDLYLICQDSLNEDKYAYIDKNQVDLSWYPGENDKFPVFTSDGEKYVTKPPQRKPKDEESMKKRLADYLANTGGKMNPIFRLMTMQSEKSQVIIDKQIECEVLALYLLKHPDDKDHESQHTDCMNNLNCMKEKFMEHHKFTREMYPDFFPILYKRKGTMIKTPPKLEKSICETPDSPEGHKKELEKWMSGIEYIGEKIADIGEVGTDFIEKLMKKGMGGGDKVLTRDELNALMSEVKSVTISDDDDEDDDEDDEHTYKVYGDVMIAKLAELEAKGVQIAHAKLDKVKPAIAKVESLASNTGEQLKKLEEVNIKPGIKSTAQGLSNAESNLKEKSLNALAGVKDGLTTAGSVAKTAKSKAKGEGSILMSKIMSNSHEGGDNEEVTDMVQDQAASTTSQSWLSTLVDHMIYPDYLPNNGDGQQSSILKVLREMGGRDEDGKDKMSDDELVKMLKSLKESTKKKAKDLNLKKDEIKQSAEIVKGVMHALLYAAGHGYGAAKDMTSHEIDTAKSLVNQLVDYATAEILDEVYEGGDDDDEEENNSASDEAYMEDNHEVQADIRDLSSDDVIQQEEESSTTKSDSGTTQDNNSLTTSDQVSNQENTTTVVDQEPEKTAADDPKDEDDNKSENNKGNPISEKNKDVPDIK